MSTIKTAASDLQPGDEYVVKAFRYGQVRLESRYVLGILETGKFIGQPFGLYEVRDDAGNVHRSNINGYVEVITRTAV